MALLCHSSLPMLCRRWIWVPTSRLQHSPALDNSRTSSLRHFSDNPLQWRLQNGTNQRPKEHTIGSRQLHGLHFTGSKRNGNQLLHGTTQLATLASLLRRYGKTKALSHGRRLHAFMTRYGYDRDILLANCVVEMYGKCGSVEEARAVFDKLIDPNLYSWNILLNAYGQNGRLEAARAVFDQIPNPDLCSWNILIKSNNLNGSLEDVTDVFSRMPNRNVASWNAMISAFVRKEHFRRALDLFHQMRLQGLKPDNLTFVCALDACTSLGSLKDGREIHVAIVNVLCEQDLMVGTALINMYGKCGKSCDARSVFERMLQPDAVSWTSMIAAFCQNGQGQEALDFFHKMQLKGINPDKIAFVCALDASVSIAALEEGREIYTSVIESGYDGNMVVGTALVNMYGKCGCLYDAGNIFDRMPHHDAVSWTVMIGVFAEKGQSEVALDLFHQMQLECIKPDKITFICALDACANLAAIKEGQDIHNAIVASRIEQDVVVGNSIVNMYGKCGSLREAKSVFDRMLNRSTFSWNAMLGSFAHNGHCQEALSLFYKMQLEGVQPDEVAFLCVLTACSHTGQVDNGTHFFVSLSRDHGIKHTEDHGVCMIDILGRAGLLDEAEEFISSMPFADVPMMWMCLLSACRIHGDVERAVRATKRCFELDPKDAASLVTLSNIYAAAGNWGDATKLREALEIVE